MADLVERLRAHASGHLPLGCTDERMLLEEAAAALEAEASKGERRGLERAAEVADDHATTWGAAHSTPAIVIASAIRALIPEAPVREAE